MPRTGPTPLPLHLSLAASACMQQGEQAQEMLQDFLSGIKAYQTHSHRRDVGDLPEFWRAGEVTLSGNKDSHILVVPSLINRSAILDLSEEHSFVRFLEAALLDWGSSMQDGAQADFDTLISERLIQALEQYERPVHVIGYCMAGTLLMAAAQIRPDLFASLTLLAAPWDFHAGDPSIRLLVQTMSLGAFSMIAQQGHLGHLWTQSLFASLEPDKTLRKYAAFAGKEKDSAEAQIFVAVEDWLNDPVDLPGDIARACIQDWYTLNRPAEGSWSVLGTEIDPAQVKCPVLIVAGNRDKLVPPQASTVLADKVQHCDVVQEDFGHIGLMASQKAPQQIWGPIKKWIAAHDLS